MMLRLVCNNRNSNSNGSNNSNGNRKCDSNSDSNRAHWALHLQVIGDACILRIQANSWIEMCLKTNRIREIPTSTKFSWMALPAKSPIKSWAWPRVQSGWKQKQKQKGKGKKAGQWDGLGAFLWFVCANELGARCIRARWRLFGVCGKQLALRGRELSAQRRG